MEDEAKLMCAFMCECTCKMSALHQEFYVPYSLTSSITSDAINDAILGAAKDVNDTIAKSTPNLRYGVRLIKPCVKQCGCVKSNEDASCEHQPGFRLELECRFFLVSVTTLVPIKSACHDEFWSDYSDNAARRVVDKSPDKLRIECAFEDEGVARKVVDRLKHPAELLIYPGTEVSRYSDIELRECWDPITSYSLY